jgi:hypothetical protein
VGFLSHPEASSTSLERGRGSYSASATYVTTEGTIEMAGAIPAAPAAFLLDRSFAKTLTPGANSRSLMCDGSSTDFASVIALGAEAGAGTSSHAGERVLVFNSTDNKSHTTAKAETTGCWRAFRRAVDLRPRGHSRSLVWCPGRRRCAPATRFRQWSVQRPSFTLSNRNAGRSIRSYISKDRD